ncbi:hypothetical protein [Kitasatospora sp. NPDC047058]|uniref:hypothetical protein n=1 Tax=Kitasatospora sp. NPDC047058 TaxID=3155620 RepID=UPI0033FA22FD
MGELIRRPWFLPLAGALVALLVVIRCLFGAAAQWQAGSLIDAEPLRVDATITAAVPKKGGELYTVTYRVGDRDYRTTALGLKRVRHPAVGVSVPLEVAAGDPSTARVVGGRYPDDEVPATFVLGSVGAAAALLILLWFALRGVRSAGEPEPRA